MVTPVDWRPLEGPSEALGSILSSQSGKLGSDYLPPHLGGKEDPIQWQESTFDYGDHPFKKRRPWVTDEQGRVHIGDPGTYHPWSTPEGTYRGEIWEDTSPAVVRVLGGPNPDTWDQVKSEAERTYFQMMDKPESRKLAAPEDWGPLKVNQLSEPYKFEMPFNVEQGFVQAHECPECKGNLLQSPNGLYCSYCGWTPSARTSAESNVIQHGDSGGAPIRGDSYSKRTPYLYDWENDLLHWGRPGWFHPDIESELADWYPRERGTDVNLDQLIPGAVATAFNGDPLHAAYQSYVPPFQADEIRSRLTSLVGVPIMERETPDSILNYLRRPDEPVNASPDWGVISGVEKFPRTFRPDVDLISPNAYLHGGWRNRTPYIYVPQSDRIYWGHPGQWHHELTSWARQEEGREARGDGYLDIPFVAGSVYTNPNNPTEQFQEVHRSQWPNAFIHPRTYELLPEHKEFLEERVGVPFGGTDSAEIVDQDLESYMGPDWGTIAEARVRTADAGLDMSNDNWWGPESVVKTEVGVPGAAPGMGDPAILPGSENTLTDCTCRHGWDKECPLHGEIAEMHKSLNRGRGNQAINNSADQVYNGGHFSARQDFPGGYREKWQPGDRAFFEYHCNQAHDSEHAQWWYRSHQPVTVMSVDHESPAPDDGGTWTFMDRGEAGAPDIYRVRWDDGAEGVVFEDELLVSSRHKDPSGYFAPPPDWKQRIGPITDPSGLGKQGRTAAETAQDGRLILYRGIALTRNQGVLLERDPDSLDQLLHVEGHAHWTSSYRIAAEIANRNGLPGLIIEGLVNPQDVVEQGSSEWSELVHNQGVFVPGTTLYEQEKEVPVRSGALIDVASITFVHDDEQIELQGPRRITASEAPFKYFQPDWHLDLDVGFSNAVPFVVHDGHLEVGDPGTHHDEIEYEHDLTPRSGQAYGRYDIGTGQAQWYGYTGNELSREQKQKVEQQLLARFSPEDRGQLTMQAAVGDSWVWLDGKIGFGNEHHDIAQKLAQELGYDTTKVAYISNSIARNFLPEGYSIAVGGMRGGYPQIWLSSVDRNFIWDAVMRERDKPETSDDADPYDSSYGAYSPGQFATVSGMLKEAIAWDGTNEPGMPRPIYEGMPVPWSAHLDDNFDAISLISSPTPDFADADRFKLAESWAQKLCILCGLPLSDPVTIFEDVGMTHWPIDGPLHSRCAKMTAVWCPHIKELLAQDGMRIIEVPLASIGPDMSYGAPVPTEVTATTTPEPRRYRIVRVDLFDGTREHVATVPADAVEDEIARLRSEVLRDLDGKETARFEAVPYEGLDPSY